MENVQKLRVYRRKYKRFRRAGVKSKAGQGIEVIGFSDEHRVLSTQLVQEYGKEHYRKCKKILSPKARYIISKRLEAGEYADREDEREPPFMAPSVNPEDYSKWCSLCNDYASRLVLCVGCRTGVCSTGIASDVGCLQWAPALREKTFIFYCPFCAHIRKKTLALELRRLVVPRMSRVWFRYDPPVLIIGVTWHLTREPFIEYFHRRLALSYHDDTDLILRVDVAMAGYEHGMEIYDAGGLVESKTGIISKFLQKYDTAKIVFILDTHSADNGRFVYTGADDSTFKACSLFEILRDCTPPEVFQYLSDGANTPKHTHKSLILNLACGASVIHPAARHLLTKGHCAEAVISLADRTTVVGEVASCLGDFGARWIQSASTDFDVLVAMTFPAEWAREHQPVISTTDGEHTLYTRYQACHPGGRPVLCGSGCKAPLRAKPKKTTVLIICRGCGSRCIVPFEKLDRRTVLGQCDLIAVEWPPPQYQVSWQVPPVGSVESDVDSVASGDGGEANYDDDSDDTGGYDDYDDGSSVDDGHDHDANVSNNSGNIDAPPPATIAQTPPQPVPAPPTTVTPEPRGRSRLPPPPPPPPTSVSPSNTATTSTAVETTGTTTTTTTTTKMAAATTSKNTATSGKIRIPPRPPRLSRTSSEPTPQKRQRADSSGVYIDTYSRKKQNR